MFLVERGSNALVVSDFRERMVDMLMDVGDSYAARNSAFMVTVGPRDKGPRINISIKPAAEALTIPQLPDMYEPD
jgi:hypothetical protein